MRQALDNVAAFGKVILIWCVIILGIPYLVGCSYVNFIAPRQEAAKEPPSIEKAQFAIVQSRTGNVIAYASQATKDGAIILLDNWYTKQGDRYKLHRDEISIDTESWGDIDIRRR